jgi:NAD(P)-dependent dehydrogenase (short-subunit alcohol dehydrogenase family)
MNPDPKDLVALVTGSTSGIGLATAEQLLAGGWRVQLHGLDNKAPSAIQKLLAQYPRRAEYIGVDLDQPERASAAIREAVLENFGRLDALVSNAAIAHHADFLTATEDEWLRLLRVNLLPAYFLTRDFSEELISSRGSVVLVSSTNAKRVNHSNMLYDVSKAALNHLGRALALELRGRGVRVNTVMPGGTLTPMLNDWLVDYAGGTEAAAKALADGEAAGQIADPNRIAAAIVNLLRPETEWITGAAIEVDGGVFLGEYWSD